MTTISSEERFKHRQLVVQPLVDAFFSYLKQNKDKVGKSSKAKANNLKPYEYFEYLLTEIPKHMEDTNRDFLTELLP